MAAIVNHFTAWRAAYHLRCSPHRTALSALPAGLESEWRRSAPQDYPGIRTDAFFFVRAAEGLCAFFDAQSSSGASCALPSEAADSVWHAWLRWDTAGLDDFCRRHFGRTIPHLERGALAAGALGRTLVSSRRLAGQAGHRQSLPGPFALDARLRMPQGYGYWRAGKAILYARLDPDGQGRARARCHPDLTLEALLAAGLIDASALPVRHLPAADGDTGDTGDTGSIGDIAFLFGGGDHGAPDADAGACADAGSGCGSSCGSSCGGD